MVLISIFNRAPQNNVNFNSEDKIQKYFLHKAETHSLFASLIRVQYD